MSNRVASCFLRCVKSSHPDIALPHGEQVIVGRGKVTRIKESRWVLVVIVQVCDQ